MLTPGAGQDKNACNDVLVGITSRGLRCNDEVRGLQNPGIFTRVSEYISWIENRGQNQGKIRVNPYIEDTCFERPEDTEGNVSKVLWFRCLEDALTAKASFVHNWLIPPNLQPGLILSVEYVLLYCR